MENRFEICCFGYDVIRSTIQCDGLSCEANHNPAFIVYYQKGNNEYCYCLNRNQLGQYWRCFVKNSALLCPSKCEKCEVCKEMSHIYTELQDSWFFYPNIKVRPRSESKPYQPVKWRILQLLIKKNLE